MEQKHKGGRLISIDALRGIAALAVVAYHAIGTPKRLPATGLLTLMENSAYSVLLFGYTGVYLFFVISGFCIHLQWAKSRAQDREFQIDFKSFWSRRLYRLYPPYFFALTLYLLLYAARGHLDYNRSFFWDLLLHLTMMHNLDQKTTFTINSAFWTLAIEEQLYLAYFLLLFIRQHLGWVRTLGICLLARVGWYFLGTYLHSLGIALPVGESAASHWFTWALGAIGVEAVFGLVRLPRIWRSPLVAGVFLTSAAGLTELLPVISGWQHELGWLVLDPIWGLGFFATVNFLVHKEQRWIQYGRVPVVVMKLAWVGLFSYSLYLSHHFVMLHTYLIKSYNFQHLIFSLLIVTPIAVAFAWLFYNLFEKPFIRQPSVRQVQLSPQ